MGRQRAMDPHVGAARDAVVIQELSSERGRPIRILAVNGEVAGPRRRQEQRRRRGRGADSAKPSSARPAEIEDTEVQTGVRLDTDDAAFAAGLRANQESLLTGLPPMTEACRQPATARLPVARSNAVTRRRIASDAFTRVATCLRRTITVEHTLSRGG